MRWVALVCALLFGVSSTAQAAHFHDLNSGSRVQQLQAPNGTSKSPADEEHCPLCVAMHWALPATMVVVVAASVSVTSLTRVCTELAAPAAWPFARFGRPPPVRS